MSVITGQGVTAYPLPDEDLSPTSKNAVSNEAVCEGLDELKNTLNHKADIIYDTASGDIASFPDGADGLPVKDLTVGIEPMQDLHGYDSPWPAGGGKNLYNPNTIGYISGVDGSISSMLANSGIKCGNEYVSIPSGSKVYYYIKTHSETNNDYAYRVAWYESDKTWINTFRLSTFGLSVELTPPENAAYIRVSSWETAGPMMVAFSAITAYEPYSNICPISGWTGANVSRTGKNLLELGNVDTTISGVAFKTNKNDGSLKLDGMAEQTVSVAIYERSIKAGAYKLSGFTDGSFQTKFLRIRDINDTSNAQYQYTEDVTITFASDTIAQIQVFVSNGVTIDTTVYPMLRFASVSDATFEPFGATLPISWQSEAGTVYGGTLDVTSGALTVDRVGVDMGTLIWGNRHSVAGGLFTVALSGRRYSDNLNVLCSQYEYKGVAPATNLVPAVCGDKSLSFYYLDGSYFTNIYVYDTAYANYTDEQFKTAMSGQTLVYELAQPQTFQLDPATVNTLLGQNNVWADTGDSTVEYPADTKLYIDKKLAALVAALS